MPWASIPYAASMGSVRVGVSQMLILSGAASAAAGIRQTGRSQAYRRFMIVFSPSLPVVPYILTYWLPVFMHPAIVL